MAKVPRIPVDKIISGAVKQYIDYVAADPSEQSADPRSTSASDSHSTGDEDRWKTVESAFVGKHSKPLRLSILSSSFGNVDDENRVSHASTAAEQSSTPQTENIFMTEVIRTAMLVLSPSHDRVLFSSKTMMPIPVRCQRKHPNHHHRSHQHHHHHHRHYPMINSKATNCFSTLTTKTRLPYPTVSSLDWLDLSRSLLLTHRCYSLRP